ncbi:oxidoreductase [Croceicoccus mobilis]|uniref:Short-chain dehydrogenase n=1 Tax=Croceicoccus mobilis TaxID=1703339 RepID=A0A917DU58_9SPHN|nr:oxidoreductase [Croceicoccus mobilis]GGD67479.1 short-chain dehydrogenase [Croceicoccus mobilis]
MSDFTAAHMGDQSGKCFIVTGANAGIGFEISRLLAARRARVVMACRAEGRALSAMQEIRAKVPDADLAFLPLDQADLASVRRAAELAAKESRIDALVNNAGVMVPPLTFTKDGFEMQFGVNHLGCFAFTSLLLPALRKSAQAHGEARVVVTASIAHKGGAIEFGNLDGSQGYDRMRFYRQSKLANLLFATELDRRLKAEGSKVKAIACHPGVAQSELTRHIPLRRLFTPLLGVVLNTAEKGAWPALQAATDPALEGGEYLGSRGIFEARGPSGPAWKSPTARDPELAKRLWDVSEQMTGVVPGLSGA